MGLEVGERSKEAEDQTANAEMLEVREGLPLDGSGESDLPSEGLCEADERTEDVRSAESYGRQDGLQDKPGSELKRLILHRKKGQFLKLIAPDGSVMYVTFLRSCGRHNARCELMLEAPEAFEILRGELIARGAAS